MSRQDAGADAVSSLVSVRWLLKPPRLLDAQPGAEGERRALIEHSAGEVERCHRVFQ
jgi:hypothetical protein